MDCVFIKARKISKALKSNRGSAVNYTKYLNRSLKGVSYTDKGNVIAGGISGTSEAPIDFWLKAEARENQTKRRASARYAKEYIMALPYNLPVDEMIKLCGDVSELLHGDSRVVNWYLHEPDKSGDQRNYHCHMLMSEREYINGVFADTKNREWNTKQTLNNHKRDIGQCINRYLEKMRLPKIKIEIEEDRQSLPDLSENQVRARKANEMKEKRTEKKIKLAEVKLSGLRGLCNTTGTDKAEPRKDNDLIAEYRQREAERIRVQHAGRAEQEQHKPAERKRIRTGHRRDRDDGIGY